MIDPTDASTVPPETRSEALTAAMNALERFLDENGLYLDAMARFELLDIALDDAAARFERDLPTLRLD